MRETWDEHFMGLTKKVAERSKDDAAQVGAMIVGPDKEIRSTGYNGFPRGVNDDVPARHERPIKYYFTVHAEENAIVNAARVGTPVKGCTMYISGRVPCSRCMGMIVNAGIAEVVVERMDPSQRKAADWAQQHEATKVIMHEGATVVRMVNEKPGDVAKREFEETVRELTEKEDAK